MAEMNFLDVDKTIKDWLVFLLIRIRELISFGSWCGGIYVGNVNSIFILIVVEFWVAGAIGVIKGVLQIVWQVG